MKRLVHVVDDNPTVRSMLTEVLRDAGFEVRAHETAEPLLETMDPASTGCVLLDLQLPGRDGLETLGVLRDRGVTVPVIFLTGNGDVATAVRALKSGAWDFLEKPIGEEPLIAAVHAACAHGQQHRAAASAHRRPLGLDGGSTLREREIAALLLSGIAG
jgi:two-component system, LuxR family, response regulator FixJ